MIVNELIEKLQSYNGETPVVMEVENHKFLELSKVFQKFDSDKRDNPKVVLTWRLWNYEKDKAGK